jgi:hypothetical protein
MRGASRQVNARLRGNRGTGCDSKWIQKAGVFWWHHYEVCALDDDGPWVCSFLAHPRLLLCSRYATIAPNLNHASRAPLLQPVVIAAGKPRKIRAR